MRSWMKGVAGCICVLALMASAEAQPAPKTTVTGVPPYALGTPMATVLAANPGLHQSSDACVSETQFFPLGIAYRTVPVPTTNYAGKVTAPIRGRPYTADLLLCFYRGSLGAIRLTWSPKTIGQPVVEWRLATKALAEQLTRSYGPELIKRNFIDDDFGGRVEIRDDQGNTLTMVSNSTDEDTLSISMWYLAAAYDHVVRGQPTPIGSY